MSRLLTVNVKVQKKLEWRGTVRTILSEVVQDTALRGSIKRRALRYRDVDWTLGFSDNAQRADFRRSIWSTKESKIDSKKANYDAQ